MKKIPCKHQIGTDCSYGPPFCKRCGMDAEYIVKMSRKKKKVNKPKKTKRITHNSVAVDPEVMKHMKKVFKRLDDILAGKGK
jgi:hypothetical protein